MGDFSYDYTFTTVMCLTLFHCFLIMNNIIRSSVLNICNNTVIIFDKLNTFYMGIFENRDAMKVWVVIISQALALIVPDTLRNHLTREIIRSHARKKKNGAREVDS